MAPPKNSLGRARGRMTDDASTRSRSGSRGSGDRLGAGTGTLKMTCLAIAINFKLSQRANRHQDTQDTPVTLTVGVPDGRLQAKIGL